MAAPEGTSEIVPGRGRLHPLTLTFTEPATERAFQAEYALGIRRHTQLGFVIATALWLLAVPVVTGLRPSEGKAIAIIILAAMVPTQVAFLILSSRPWFLRWMQLGSAFVNITAGVGEVLLLVRAGALDRYGFAVIMVQVVFASLALRLRFVYALVATCLQIGFYVFMYRMVGVAPEAMAATSFLILCVQAAAMFGAYSLERSDRVLYLQQQLIEEQTRGLEEERKKTEKLLLNVLPAPIAARLKEHDGAIAEAFADATILFSDIVGFTPLASRLSPTALVALLDDIFTRFDDLAERHGLEKIKTIGDAYMVVGGVPTRRADHALAIARMGLDMLEAVAECGRKTGYPLGIRIGINSGPVVAGVIGKKKFIYDLWGDAVNTASRMESHGLSGQVHVSEATAAQLAGFFELETRGTITVKGKGEMRTFFLRAEVAQKKDDPELVSAAAASGSGDGRARS
jgi:class 3 adenylate cyclase